MTVSSVYAWWEGIPPIPREEFSASHFPAVLRELVLPVPYCWPQRPRRRNRDVCSTGASLWLVYSCLAEERSGQVSNRRLWSVGRGAFLISEEQMWSRLYTYLFPLGPDAKSPSGTFELHVPSGKMEWSEGMFSIHGLRPGQVVPTVELFMAHKHPLDREHVLSLWAKLLKGGGQGALLHRISDIRGKERRVFSALQAVAGPAGQVDYVRGFMVDVTQSLRIESHDAASAAIERVYAHRDLIEQAKGIVMALRAVDGPAAFDILAAVSQQRNAKLHIVAEELVRAAQSGKAAGHLAELLGRTDP